MPAAFTVAFPHDHTAPLEQRVIETPEGKRPYMNVSLWSFVATLAGLPATVAPVGLTKADLPVGIQIVAPMWEDGTSIAFAGQIEKLVGGFAPPAALRESVIS